MPARASAPLASTCFEIRFKPCTSVTEYIIRMSEGPTYCPTLPEATVEIITLGRPMGRRRIAGVTIAVRSEEHTSELQSLMRISYAVFCLKKKNNYTKPQKLI